MPREPKKIGMNTSKLIFWDKELIELKTSLELVKDMFLLTGMTE